MRFLIRIIAVCAVLVGLLWFEWLYDSDIFMDTPKTVVYASENDDESVDEDNAVSAMQEEFQ
jgi:hypothetical protein